MTGIPGIGALVGLARGHSPIGVDLGSRQVKLVQLARSGAGWRVSCAASYPRCGSGAFDAEEAQRLAEVLDRRGFRGRTIVAGLSEAQLMSSMLELPPRAPGVPIEQIARMELARVHQRDAAGFEFAQWEVPPPARASKSTHVMALACAHERSNPLLDALEAQDLTVRALDAELCALARACGPLLRACGGMSAILDIGWSACRLVIVHCGVIVYSRAIEDAGLVHLYAALEQELEIDQTTVQHLLRENVLTAPAAPAGGGGAEEARAVLSAHLDALVKEIHVAFSYASHQYPEATLAGLLLAGGGADLGGVLAHLGSALGVPAQVVRPASLVGCGGAGGSGAAEALTASASTVAALGLALYDQGAS